MNALTNVFRIAERSQNTQAVSYVCRSCRNRLASTQHLQLHTAKPKPSSSITSRAFTTTSRLRAEGADDPPLDFSKYPDPKQDPNYVEALTVDGLKWVGSDKWLEKIQDVKDQFKGWKHPAPKHPAPDQHSIKSSEQRIIQVAQKVLDRETLKALQISVKKGETSQDNAWLSVPLTDPKIKFEMVKGLAKATGNRISDYQLQSVKTWKGLRNALMQKPAEKKLFKRLRNSKAFAELPNVALISKRVTPIHKENAIGRWKLIKEELLERGLPVTGHHHTVKKSFSVIV